MPSSVRSRPFLSNVSFRHSGSTPAESGTPSSKQYTWGWRGYARGLSEFEPRLWMASEWKPNYLSVCLFTRDQVWGGSTPSPQRNVSASSAPATTDALPSQGEMPFRSNMNEGWRSNSGTWADDDTGEFALVGHSRGRRNCWPHVHTNVR